MSRYNDEAANLKMAILNSKRILHLDDEDILWDIIIDDVLDGFYNSKGVDLNNLPKFEEPFVSFERPDIYYEKEDFIVGIEHFQIDSSKRTRKGSSLVQEQKRIDDEIIADYHSQPKAYFYIEKKLNVDFSYENYVKSIVETFKKHEKNIPEYRANLSKIAPNKKVYLAFFIEDITSLGNYIMTAKGRETLNPVCTRELIDKLVKVEGLDYVLTRVQRDYIYTLHFQRISEEYIKSLYSECYDLSKETFITYTPVVASTIGNSEDDSDR